MKTINFNKIILLLIGLVVFNACVQDDDFDTPNIVLDEPVLEVEAISIDALISLYEQEFLSYIDDLGLDIDSGFDQDAIAALREDYVISLENTDNYVSGYVVSSDEAGNFFEEMIIQNRADQGSAGVRVMIDVNPLFGRYRFGQLIYVKLVELHFGVSNGVLTLGISEELEKITSFSEEDFIKRSPQIEEIVPTEIAFSDFDDSLENVFIKLNNSQFERSLVIGTSTTFAGEPQDEFDGERTLESCDQSGASIIVSSSTFADFKSLPLPSGQGSISGILTRNFFGDTFNLAINTPEDIDFGGEENRCDPLIVSCGLASTVGDNNLFADDFEGLPLNTLITANGWTNYIEAGTVGWEAYTQTGTNASQGISARVGSFGSDDVSSIAWLITPQINLDANTGITFSFESSTSFADMATMEVLISQDWDGTEAGVANATWGILDDAYVAQESDFFGDWLESGNVDLSCLSGTAHIAFKYEGRDNDDDFNGTYELDLVTIDSE